MLINIKWCGSLNMFATKKDFWFSDEKDSFWWLKVFLKCSNKFWEKGILRMIFWNYKRSPIIWYHLAYMIISIYRMVIVLELWDSYWAIVLTPCSFIFFAGRDFGLIGWRIRKCMYILYVISLYFDICNYLFLTP